MGSNLGKDLQTAERQLSATILRMKQIRREFIIETVTFIQQWYVRQTRERVKGQAALSKRLGIQKISDLKSQVSALQQDADEMVYKFLNQDHLWWSQEQKLLNETAFSEEIAKTLRLIAGKLGPILEQYGYITNDPQDPGFWREWDKLGIQRPPDARPYYPHSLDWSSPMKALIDEYMELIREYTQHSEEIDNLKKNMDQNEAEDLWDKA